MDALKKLKAGAGYPAARLAAAFLLLTGVSASGCGRENGAPGDREAVVRTDPARRTEANPVRAKIERYLAAAVENWNFQGSVLVARGSGVILGKGLGFADLEKEIPNTPDTKFQIASVTKVFTAAAVMKLAEEGKIRIDEPASRYLPEYEDILGTGITIGHLLSHSSGLPEFTPGAAGRADMTQALEPREFIEAIRSRRPFFAPGLGVRYSNVGYVLLGLVIEKVTGRSYDGWLEGHVLKPLGMSDTGTDPDYPSRPGFARGYIDDRSGALRPAPFIHPAWAYSAGALYSTVEDLHKFDRALSSPGFLTAASLETMFRPRNRTFSFGWLVGDAFGRRFEAHGGGGPGFSAWVERWPDDDAFVAVLSNVTGAPAGEVGRSLAAAVFGEAFVLPAKRIPVSVPPAELEQFAGDYRMKDGEIRRVVLDGDALFVVRGDGPRHPILPYARDSFFFVTDKSAFIRFTRDARGRVTGQVFHQLGVDEPAQKM